MTTTTDAPVLTSTVPGAAGVRTLDSVNPADLSDVVARVELAAPEALVEAARRANAAQRAWAAGPAAGARPGHRRHRPARGGELRGPGAAGDPRGRQADRGVPRRGAGDRRHLRLLPGRGTPAVRADRAERDARQAAVHVPGPGRDGGRSSPRATSRSRCRRGTWCRRCSPATPSSGSRPSTPPPPPTRSPGSSWPAACPEGLLTVVHADGAATFEGLAAGAGRRPRRQGRASRARPTSGGASASSAAGTCSRRASSWAARTRWSSPPTPTSTSPSRARCSAASARPGSGARASAR